MPEPRSRIEQVRDQFTRQAEVYLRMQQTTDEPKLRALVAVTGVRPEHRVLDLACGPAFLTMAFAERARAVVGLDATDRFLELARAEAGRRLLPNLSLCRGDVEHLPFAGAAFDVVACRAAFHHFVHPERVVGEIARVLGPGGRAVVADMLGSPDPAKATYHDRMERLCDPTHVRAIPEADFEGLFATASLTVRQRHRVRVDYDLEEWIEHGGPDPESADEIRRLATASLGIDRSGLDVRREDGRLRFSHIGVAFLVETG